MTSPAAQPASLSRRIVRAVRAVKFEQLAPEVIEKVKTGLFDMLSCAFEAGSLPWGEQAIEMASRAPGPAAVIGTDVRAAATEAAFANAVLGHGLVREDMHTGAVSHLGVVIYPTLLALYGAASGRDFIVAAVCGYEVGAAIGRALMDQDLVRRFRPTGITGPIAGAIAASRFLGLNENATVSAIGLAANATGGLNEWPYSGGDEMFFHPGFAARNAVTAALLAQAGARASESALDGPSGLFAGLGKADRVGAVLPFSGTPEILSVYYKPAPACNYAQTACQAALALAGTPLPCGRGSETTIQSRDRKGAVNTTDIAAISVKVPSAAARYPGCDYAGPFDRVLQAKMSIQYCVSAALKRGVIEEANYRLLSDPEINRLAAATTVEADPEFTAAYPAAQGAGVIVTLRSGQVLRHRMQDLVPASPAEIRARFQEACGILAVESFIDRLEEQSSLETLNMLLTTP